jgi:hypothetical protein
MHAMPNVSYSWRARNGIILKTELLVDDEAFADPSAISELVQDDAFRYKRRFVSWSYFDRPETLGLKDDAFAMECDSGNPQADSPDGSMHENIVMELVRLMDRRLRDGDTPRRSPTNWSGSKTISA